MRALVVLLAASSVAVASPEVNTESEIEHLLTAIGESGCTFVRNGKTHSAVDAEAHLRMKYRRGKRHATTAENFIERLASKSSMSRKPYTMRCEVTGEVSTNAWLSARLSEYRQQASDDNPG